MSPTDQFALVRPWLDGLPRGLLLIDATGIMYANGRAREWLGGQVLGHALPDLPSLLEAGGFQPDEARAARWSRGPERLEVTLEQVPGGTMVWLDPVTQSLSRRLKFLSVAAHDIRGALANARSFAALLLHPKWTLEPKVRSGLETVVRNTDRAMALTSEVLDSLRSEILPLDVDVRELPLQPLIDGVLERARRAGNEHEVGVEASMGEGPLPHWPTDPQRLSHALDGVLEHAMSRTPPHSSCRLEVEAQPDRLVIRVHDGGTPPETLDGLFARDLRVDQATKLDAGFRLSLARAEVVALGGALEAENDPSGALRLTLSFDRSAATLAAGTLPA